MTMTEERHAVDCPCCRVFLLHCKGCGKPIGNVDPKIPHYQPFFCRYCKRDTFVIVVGDHLVQ